jgi:hypothetical protein
LYLWRSGAWNDFVRQTVVFPLYYRNYGLPAKVPFALVWLAYVEQSEPLAIGLALLGIIWAAIAEFRLWFKVLLPIALLCTGAYSAAGGRLFPNYFILFGAAMLVSIALMPFYVEQRFPRTGLVLRVGLIALGALSASKPLGVYLRTGSVFVPPTENVVETAAEYVRLNSSPADGVLVWGFAPQIYVLSGRYNTFKDATLLSITGGNFASVLTADQGRLPEMVGLFEEYLTRNPPKILVYYTLTRPSVGPCAGKGVIQRNIDFNQVSHLKRLRDLIGTSYRSTLITSGLCDRAEVFVRKQGV